MALNSAAVDTDGLVLSTFAPESLPDRFQMPEKSISKAAANKIIRDKLMLQGKPKLKIASPVSTWTESECDKLISQAINNNYVDTDEYPDTTELQNRCVNIIGSLFNAPFGDGEEAVGVGTVSSWEAIMLVGLAFKRKWQHKRMTEGMPYDKPNIVTGVNVQVCWEKFAQYFEVERKEVKLKEGSDVMDPVKAVEMVDENTICVVAILCSPYNGEFEDVEKLNDCLQEKGRDTPIHVDATNGGFIAPFLDLKLKWDFRLPLVKSINVSGQKHGLVHPRIGWVIWRAKQDLPKELTFPINYLRADRPHFTVNFSEGPSQIIAQYYQFIRLGFEGYRGIGDVTASPGVSHPETPQKDSNKLLHPEKEKKRKLAGHDDTDEREVKKRKSETIKNGGSVFQFGPSNHNNEVTVLSFRTSNHNNEDRVSLLGHNNHDNGDRHGEDRVSLLGHNNHDNGDRHGHNHKREVKNTKPETINDGEIVFLLGHNNSK